MAITMLSSTKPTGWAAFRCSASAASLLFFQCASPVAVEAAESGTPAIGERVGRVGEGVRLRAHQASRSRFDTARHRL